ncbi:DNA-binding protein [Ramlibacter sp. XY19]|uniref:helix-turn-helix domain-containing protein n=1 Tax=Ramlibacter paludis TaxID=2908000 RepID=UPI0023DB23F8|nr:DNA-binding protein [Ramlibacter paludis]MCG2593027.1 DNA-binding protein [Ramlibacter paludis]
MTKKNESNKTNVVALKAGTTSTNPPGPPVDTTRPGARLLQALKQRARELGQEEAEMARELQVTPGYILQMERGIRAVNTISDDFSGACAVYLDIPRLQVLMLAERVTPEDLFRSVDIYKKDLSRAVDFIAADPKWNAVLTSELRSCSTDSLFGVVRLYEAATGTVLMPNQVDVTAMVPADDKGQ